MKTIGSEIGEMLTAQVRRGDLRALLKFLVLLVSVIIIFSIAFHFIMLREGREFSWVTGVYWTLTVMSTLGFGDITFHSDLGLVFTLVVLITGIFLLLILLPFVFIRFFYAPWLESLQQKAPRRIAETITGHVIICEYDEMAAALIHRLVVMGLDYVVIEPNKAHANELKQGKVSVVTGAYDDRSTYEAAGLDRAKLLVANLDDIVNTNIIITAREVAEDTPIVATSIDPDAVDVLELAGATHVVALRDHLGEQLASRVSAGNAQVHIVGRYRGLAIAEFPIRNTVLSGQTLGDVHVRERTGVTVAAVAKRGGIEPGTRDTVLDDDCIGVAVATDKQLEALDELLAVEVDTDPVLVIGGGKVGCSAARALRARGIPTHVIERDPSLRERLEKVADEVFIGDAADLNVILQAGLRDAPSVILTTNSDATNIFLAVYCRKLNPEVIIVSRIGHERNIEAIHRAGSDFALTDFMLGVHSVLCTLEERELTLLGEGLDLFTLDVPSNLVGISLKSARMRAKTGLQVVAIERDGEFVEGLTPEEVLKPSDRLLAIGTTKHRDEYAREFGRMSGAPRSRNAS